MKLFKLLFIIAVILANPKALAKTVNAVVSFSVLEDIVKQVGGKHVKVMVLIRPNSDPHTFEPAPKDIFLLARANVIFINGLGLEKWINRLVTTSGYLGKVIIVSTGVKARKIEENGQMITDPHAWNSAHNGALYARNIMNVLIGIDPQNANYFRQRGQAYIQKLEKLNTWAKTKFALIPQIKRNILINHNAFGYFGAEYGVKFLSPFNFSTETEVSANYMANLINQMKQKHISIYFTENQTDPRLVKQIASVSGAHLGGTLYPETLSNLNSSDTTYAATFRYNVTMLLSSMK